MTVRTSPWPAGVPCWADLSVPDVPAASAFYRTVLGWDVAEPDEQYGGYVLATVDGHAAAGIGPQHGPGPVAWTLYLATDDADTTATAALAHGATVLQAPMDVGPLGRLALLTDPTGAAFGLWQAGLHLGSAHVNAPGGLTWEDLRSPDPDAARAFYGELFGYRYDTVEMAGEQYTTFALPGDQAPLGGMGPYMGADGDGPHWLVYFGVADTAAAVAATRKAGGGVVADAFPTPFGAMAGLTDPAGAVFWVVESGHAEQPDRSG